tara:strand:- start:1179 stop:2765 length:1587 start_codon:yes stop_codon:yes gene_type:complete
MNDIDQALIRLFVSRIKLGVFDPPTMNPYSNIPRNVVDSKPHKELALEIARQSLVLLKNQENMLPLQKSVKSVAVIGPNANFCRFGTYSGRPSVKITPLEGIKNIIPNADIAYAQGTTILETELPNIPNSSFYTADGKPGVTAEYFKGFDVNKKPDLIKIEKSPNISWKFDGTPDSTIFTPNYFSVRFSGNIMVEESGNYLINVNGIDGIKFHFRGVKKVDKISENYSHTTFKAGYLDGGVPYPFVIEYFEDEGWGEVRLGISKVQEGLVDDAISKARSSELVIMVMGTYDYIESEGRDRKETDLPFDQKNLLKKIYDVNKNIVLVLINGSTISLPWASERIPAIIEAWYPGQSGGRAIAEVLFGDYNPGGKLPITFYKSMEDLPPFDDYDIRNGRTYMYLKNAPLYPFGYGLSYTDFQISDVRLKSGNLSKNDTLIVYFKITNVGSRSGSEVPQLYIEDKKIKKLKAFKRIFLDKGKSLNSSLKVEIPDLEIWNADENHYVIPSRKYNIYVGTSSQEFVFTSTITVH